ncbi:2-acyl-glycerophospho-ethanolamine acyltransferase [Jannaschia seosinensis]|uniref:2-acyl-glycerophospho-ethanolamine acyltransferase n=1 Tax=Jannaschia seosinensis TaxID=313367 RepID=A0A0M7B742_9RHOB|nr:1-acyl-sn-glycerol-3-phosphate acyltransferase [Jannaschia seosinensis]CUH26104.1 2-acyl-glycerophospho-ethanolamine acyltransferase [Jannaschia seosinensis]
MRDRLDPLIAERAPWLFDEAIHHRAARAVLDRLLAYERSVEIGAHYVDLTVPEIMGDLARRIARRVTATGLENVPASGPALIVANHPTGIADGIILHDLLRKRRDDAFYYANCDILRILPQFSDIIVPVEWRTDKRTVTKTRETMQLTRAALEKNRLGVIFPAGRLAKRRGLHLHERPWMASAAMIARKFELPVIPVHIRARNSAMFYAFDAIHPTLRDITLFHETLNKDVQPYHITIGRPLDGATLPKSGEEGIAVLRDATLRLADERGGAIRLTQNRPGWRWRPSTPRIG